MNVLLPAALWAFVGGAFYSGGRLATALWGGAEIEQRAKRLALAQFALALLLAPAAGAALTEIVLNYFPGARIASTAFLIGLLVTPVTAILTEPAFLRDILSALLRGAADRLSGAPKP